MSTVIHLFSKWVMCTLGVKNRDESRKSYVSYFKNFFKDVGAPPPFTIILNTMTIIWVHFQIEPKIAHSFPVIASGNTVYQNNRVSCF